jgi:hypothetical protein
MQIILVLLILAVILGSPLWISLAVSVVPRRWWYIDLLLCGLQTLIGYGWWWFWWGGGIGREAHASSAGQWACLLFILPIVVAAVKHVMKPRSHRGRGFSVIDKLRGR